MTAFQAGTASAEMIAASDGPVRHVYLNNLSGTAMHIAVGVAAGTASGVKIAGTSNFEFNVPQNKAVYAITAGSAQTTPLDTRYEIF